jgi:hypothetical protein
MVLGLRRIDKKCLSLLAIEMPAQFALLNGSQATDRNGPIRDAVTELS